MKIRSSKIPNVPDDRSLELQTNASHGALEYLRLARDSLACIEGAGVSIARAKRDLDVIMKAVENFHTIAARKLRYQLKLETENADQDFRDQG